MSETVIVRPTVALKKYRDYTYGYSENKSTIMNSLNNPRYQGKITSWKGEQGFGFIAPNGGGLPSLST
jgi:hypothetical protein